MEKKKQRKKGKRRGERTNGRWRLGMFISPGKICTMKVSSVASILSHIK